MGNWLSPCSPAMLACTELAATPARSARRQRRREVSSTVPEANRRSGGRPVCSCASTVSTSQGFETITNTAFGDASTSSGIIFEKIRAFVPTSCSRVCPGCCAAPAVTITTCEPSVTATSADPVMSLVPVKSEPWARSSASASTFAALMS